ncbi:hypothetical protein F5Y11DRAFT_299545 [Daldinia sp. FL1419]|nr:hypothetical protein F5Y11DRAFT_299545 [Daldinia sp. FL1419]
MVARKPLPDGSSANTNTPPAVSIQGVRQELWPPSDSDSESARAWAREDPVISHPSTTNPTSSVSHNTSQDIPHSLQPGAAYRNEENPWDDRDNNNGADSAIEPKAKLDEMPKALWPGGARFETNPFKRKPKQSGSTIQDNQDSHESPATGLPLAQTSAPMPTGPLSQLHISEPETNTNPWQPSNTSQTAPPLSDQEPKGNVWDSGLPSRAPSTGPASNSHSLLPLETEGESRPWDDVPAHSSSQTLPRESQEVQEIFDDQHAWDDLGSNSKGKQPDLQASHAHPETVDGWNLIDHEPIPEPEPEPGTLSKQSTWENFMDEDGEKSKEVTLPSSAAVPTTDPPPTLPPRRALNEEPPPQLPRRQSPDATNKSETYQIKNINWVDATAAKNPRRSPILVQNANGPCPLVALVNALTLTTPASQVNSNLVETLRSREQISLNFLLEAVVDELMTHRHTNPEVSLPDMTELYAFLKGLHTGMNVNPRFVPSTESSPLRSQQPVHENFTPGTFESTRDMKLYATFSIPLIHGWLPPKDDPVYDSFTRQASTYDDAQSILFREEELEDKLSNSEMGLTEQEQQLYQDIIIIKSFLTTSATQLTPWGLEVITKAIRPGTVAILFRNDHFSTLYRHPQTQKLYTLVTDAGYYTHNEVVWESLVDVRGERTEFFSGDFRIVGGPQQQRSSGNVPGAQNEVGSPSSNTHGSGWQTAQNRRSRSNRTSEPGPSTSLLPKHEQEDRDLALALQLQEEEEERHRAEQAARRRESQLSEQFIEQQGRQGTPIRGNHNQRGSIGRSNSGPLPPARTSSVNQSTSTLASRGRPVQQVRSLIPPASTTHRPADGHVDDAPPSYEQASKSTPYVPPTGHPSHPDSSPGSVSATPRARSTINGQNSAGPSTPGGGRRSVPPPPAGSTATSTGGGKEKDCIVM